MIVIPELLSAEQAGTIVAALDSGRFNDGNATTGNAGVSLKNNLELAADQTRKQLGDMVLAAANAFPAKYSFPMFSRYDPVMYYDFHTDAAIMNMVGANPVRTDLSCSVFLQDPDSYGGGELTVEGPEGRRQIKLPAGHAALYNTADLHRVEEVTEGAWLAAVFWVQSHDREAGQRAVLTRLNELCRRLAWSGRPKADQDHASRSVHDLLRMWAA